MTGKFSGQAYIQVASPEDQVKPCIDHNNQPIKLFRSSVRSTFSIHNVITCSYTCI